MARIPQGLLGPLSGAVGPVVGTSWRGIPCIRARAGDYPQPNTDRQQAERAKFALVARLLQTMKGLIYLGYRDLAIGKTELNSAQGYLYLYAVAGEYPRLTIDWPQVLISQGRLPNASAALAAGEPGAVRFNWTNNAGTGKALSTDRVILAAHNEALQHTEYAVGPATRASETSALPVPGFRGHTVHTWISFTSENNKHIATSVYTGRISVD